jgi:alpha-amylase
MKALPRFAAQKGIQFWTPSEVVAKMKPVDQLSVMHPISWADEERDTSAWLGNTLQQEAVHKLYSIGERVRLCRDRRIKQDWYYLQASDHFFYMSTKHSQDGSVHSHYSPYDSPYMAFTNYMNVLSDFIIRVEEQYPETIDNEELNSLLLTIRNQETEISELKHEVEMMRNNIVKDTTGDFPVTGSEEPAKSTVKAAAPARPRAKAKKATARTSATKKK